jgi:two-component system, LytTR family, sensor kinase
LLESAEVSSRIEVEEWRSVLAALAGFWTVHLLLMLSRLAVSESTFGVSADVLAARWLALDVVGLALSLIIFRVIRRFRGGPFLRTIAVAALLTIPAAGLYGAVGDWLFYYSLPERIAAIGPYQPYTLQMFWYQAVPWTASIFASSALVLAIRYSSEARERERRLADVEVLAHKAQLQALRYQINPHFLFNALNSISAMIWEGRPQQAEEMLVGLSQFLHRTMTIDATADVTLHQEIVLQQLYLDIERVRFSDRLSVEFDVAADVANARVPCLILQPLVENALKHAVAPSLSPIHLRISARREQGRLRIEVADDGEHAAGGHNGIGIGLNNVSQRLSLRYGDRHEFQSGATAPRGYRVMIDLPLDFA